MDVIIINTLSASMLLIIAELYNAITKAAVRNPQTIFNLNEYIEPEY